MRLTAVLLLAVSTIALADGENEGLRGRSSRPWVSHFENLVAFGDRYETHFSTMSENIDTVQ
jgi:hypothetical protein